MLLHGFVGDGVGTWGLSARGAVRRVHSYRLGLSRSRPFISRARIVPVGRLRVGRSKARRNPERQSAYVAGLSFGAVVALELFRRHVEVPQRLILASAYAGWAGSFRSDIVEERLRWSLEVSRLQRPSWSPRSRTSCLADRETR